MKKIYFFILLACCCVYFSNIAQPSSVAAGEWFNITINGHYTQCPYGCPGTWWLAMMMPIGTDIDSIRYTSSGGQTGVVTDIDTVFANWFTQTHPCDTNMCWLVCSTGNLESESLGTFTANVYAYAADTIATGQFLIDYYIGFTIGCGIEYVDSIMNLHLTVYPAGITRDATPALNAEQKLYPTIFRERLNIHVKGPSNFNIYSSSGRLIRNLFINNAGYWDGRDSHGSKVPPGNYMIVGNGVRTKVIFVE